jgi:hypothetical protein
MNLPTRWKSSPEALKLGLLVWNLFVRNWKKGMSKRNTNWVGKLPWINNKKSYFPAIKVECLVR